METRNSKRLQLVLIASLFVLPVLAAMILVGSGWVPGARSFNVGIVPQRSVEDVEVKLADGTAVDWHDRDRRWSLVAIPGRQCGEACILQIDLMHRAKISLNQNATRLRLIYLGTPPGGERMSELMRPWQQGVDIAQGFASWKPDVDDGVAAVLVKPGGVAVTFYPNGFDASGLRKDLAKVTK